MVGKQVAVIRRRTAGAAPKSISKRSGNGMLDTRYGSKCSAFPVAGRATQGLATSSRGRRDIVIGKHRSFRRRSVQRISGLVVIDEKRATWRPHTEKIKELFKSLDGPHPFRAPPSQARCISPRFGVSKTCPRSRRRAQSGFRSRPCLRSYDETHNSRRNQPRAWTGKGQYFP